MANARALAAALVERGFNIVSGGTDNHLFLLSLIGREITGKDADAALGAAHITVNKNAVPNDPRPPMITSGLRLGTPASTTRGFRRGRDRARSPVGSPIFWMRAARERVIERVRPAGGGAVPAIPGVRRLRP